MHKFLQLVCPVWFSHSVMSIHMVVPFNLQMQESLALSLAQNNRQRREKF